MRFLYYLFIVRRRLTFLILTLACVTAAWSMQGIAARAMIRNEAASVDRIRLAFQQAVVTDWDMCIQFFPEMADQEHPLNAMAATSLPITNADLERFNDLVAQCARVTVPLTGERAALARKKANFPAI